VRLSRRPFHPGTVTELKQGPCNKAATHLADAFHVRCRAEVRMNFLRKPSAQNLGAFGIAALFSMAVAFVAAAQSASIPYSEAKNHVGERSTVCGIVVDAHFVSSGKGQPTFLHFGEAYPNQIFTVVIWGRDRAKFGRPEVKYLEKEICVTGKITSYLRIPEIEASEAEQIRMRK
jgi:hypothetical protein